MPPPGASHQRLEGAEISAHRDYPSKPLAVFLKSEDVAHATRSTVEHGVGGKVGFFDDLKIWNAEPARPYRESADAFPKKMANPLGITAPRVSVARPMGHNKGNDNVKKRNKRRAKNDRLALAKIKTPAPAK